MKNSRQEAVLTAILMAAGLLPLSAKANISFSKYGEELIYTLHTHLTSPTWRLPSSDKIKTAAVCFISDTENCSDGMFGNTENSGGNGGSGGAPDYDLNDAERCRKEGYSLTSCAAGKTPEGFCIYNSNYFARCVCPSGYKTCEPPYYGVGTACGDKYASCEEDTERACKEQDSEFTDTCQTGWKVDPNNACEYDATFGKCCNLCEGYDYTTIPEGYIADGVACVDCNGTSKYKIKINPCDGFQDCGVMGGDTGAKTCMSGSQIKYDNCKPCPNLGTLSSCPSPFTCTYEECSNRYYKSGCQSGYDWNATAQTCTPQCSSGYQYTCTGTGYSGGSGTACNGLYEACTCSSGYYWSGESCVKYNDCMRGSQIGHVLNSDMTVTPTKQSGKTPIGVVVCSYENGGGQALALNSLGSYEWGGYGTDIPGLTYYDSVAAASQDVASCENSKKIMALGDNRYQAAWATNEYSTEGTSVGDWCLPAAGILNSLFFTYSSINYALRQAGGTRLEARPRLWSSSKLRSGHALFSNFLYDYGLDDFSTGFSLDVRPVIGFCKSGYEYDKSTDSCKIRTCGDGYSTSLQSECLEYDTCQSGSTTYYRCTECNPCSTMCNSECVNGYDDISEIGRYETYETCQYNNQTYYRATSCDKSHPWNRLDDSRGYCYTSGGDNLPCL